MIHVKQLKPIEYIWVKEDTNKVPDAVRQHIFRFLSHPASDAIRFGIGEYQAFYKLHEPNNCQTSSNKSQSGPNRSGTQYYMANM